MGRIEKLLLSKMPVWIVVSILALAAAGTVMFGTIVQYATERDLRNLDDGRVPGLLSRVAIEIAESPRNLRRLLVVPHPVEAGRQRFDGQAGLDLADAVRFGGKGGYLLLTRHLPESTLDELKGTTTLFELIDLSRRKTVHVWNMNSKAPNVHLFPDGSLIALEDRQSTIRLDACSNVEWQKRWKAHHSIERDADGNFWTPVETHGLLKFSPAGKALSRISLTGALTRSGYRHLLYSMPRHLHRLHMNDVQPVLRDGPFWRRGDLFVSLRSNSVVLLYRPATDEVVWLRQGPWLHQHDVDVVSDSEISVFSNNAAKALDGRSLVLGANEVYVYDFATGEARSPWREAMRRHEVQTVVMGAATLLGDGGLIVEEHDYGRVLRLSADGALRWSYVNRASDGRVHRLGWNRYLDAEYGAEVARSVAAADCTSSSPQAGAAH